jgi:hypothetical protein
MEAKMGGACSLHGEINAKIFDPYIFNEMK